jgi:hypothetical protein
VPIRDVRFVPELPLPERFGVGVALLDVRGPRAHERRPRLVVARRIEAAAVERVGAGVPVRRRLRRESLGHEAELDERKRARIERRVHDPVDQRVVVDGVPGGVLCIDVGGAPLGRERAVAGVEEEVGADVNRRPVQRRKRAQELLAVRRGRDVGFVVAVERPHAFERSSGGRRVDRDRHRLRLTVDRRESAEARGERVNERAGAPGHAGYSNDLTASRSTARPFA